MDQCAGECQFLLHPTRERTRPTVLETFYLGIDGLDAVVTCFDGGVEERGEEVQVLLHCQVLIEGELSRHVTHTTAYLLHLLHHIETVHRGTARLWLKQ